MVYLKPTLPGFRRRDVFEGAWTNNSWPNAFQRSQSPPSTRGRLRPVTASSFRESCLKVSFWTGEFEMAVALELERCIDMCTRCASECRSCADDCGTMTGMEECARICRECADHCDKTVTTMRNSSNADCASCSLVCDRCAAECEKYDYGFMRKCAKTCRDCAEQCRKSAAA